MTNTNNIIYRGPGALRIAAGVFLGLVLFVLFAAGTIAALFMLGVLNVAGVL